MRKVILILVIVLFLIFPVTAYTLLNTTTIDPPKNGDGSWKSSGGAYAFQLRVQNITLSKNTVTHSEHFIPALNYTSPAIWATEGSSGTYSDDLLISSVDRGDYTATWHNETDGFYMDIDYTWGAITSTGTIYVVLDGLHTAVIPSGTTQQLIVHAKTSVDTYPDMLQLHTISGEHLGWSKVYNGTEEIELICDFQIEPYPAEPGQVLTLTDLTEGGVPTAYDWMVKNPMGVWDNTTIAETEETTYLLGYGGLYTFSHKVFSGDDYWECDYDYFGGTNYTPMFNVTPTIVGNFSINLTKNITGTFDDLNLTVIDKNFFSDQIHNMTYFGNYSHAWTEFCDNMTSVVNVTFNEVEDRINPFLYLTDLLLVGHNQYVVLLIPLLGFVSFPLLITASVINIIPVSIQMLISLGLLIDFIFLVLRGPD